MTNPQAGWYDDGTGRTRYWDGAAWTDQFAPTEAISGSLGTNDVPQVAGEPIIAQATSVDAPASLPLGSTAATPPAPPTPTHEGAPLSAAPTVETSGSRNVLGIIGVVAAAVGFILACVPGALIVGWVLLPIGFILSIVALFLKGPKGLAITGLILSVVGTIVGFVVFFAVVGNSFNEAFGSDVAVTSSPSASADEEETEPSEAAAEVGTRENPAAIGSTISSDDFDVVINSVQFNQNDAVLAANPVNQAPPAGTAYAVINATITYKGADSAYAAYVGLDFVTDAGNVVSPSDTFAVAPDPSFGLDELYKGASSTGNQVLAVPADGAGLVRVRPGMLADEVFVSVK